MEKVKGTQLDLKEGINKIWEKICNKGEKKKKLNIVLWMGLGVDIRY